MWGRWKVADEVPKVLRRHFRPWMYAVIYWGHKLREIPLRAQNSAKWKTVLRSVFKRVNHFHLIAERYFHLSCYKHRFSLDFCVHCTLSGLLFLLSSTERLQCDFIIISSRRLSLRSKQLFFSFSFSKSISKTVILLFKWLLTIVMSRQAKISRYPQRDSPDCLCYLRRHVAISQYFLACTPIRQLKVGVLSFPGHHVDDYNQ